MLFAEALRQEGVRTHLLDARQVIRTDDVHGNADPDIKVIQKLCRSELDTLLDQGFVIVTQGFIGSTESGATTTLGKGGSDYTAALLAEALQAQQVYIWTDVCGIFSCDPRIIEQCHLIAEISFVEAAELATFGARILHPATLWPAIRCNIPVFIGSTFAPNKGGTWIRDRVQNSPKVRALAVRRNQTLVTVRSFRMFQTRGVLAELFDILSRHAISVDLVTTSEVSVALTLDNPERLSAEVIRELSAIAEIEIENELALIAVVGNDLTSACVKT